MAAPTPANTPQTEVVSEVVCCSPDYIVLDMSVLDTNELRLPPAALTRPPVANGSKRLLSQQTRSTLIDTAAALNSMKTPTKIAGFVSAVSGEPAAS